MVGHPGDHGGDALVEQRHGSGGVDEGGEWLCQFLGQSRLQGSECSKLHADVGGEGGGNYYNGNLAWFNSIG